MRRGFFGAPVRFYSKAKSKFEWESGSMPVYDFGIAHSTKTMAYGWGLAAAGELGLNKNAGQLMNKVKMPRRITLVDKHSPIDVACGRGFSIFAVKGDKRVYGCGLNTSGQLGPHTVNRLWHTVPVAIPVQFQSMQTKVKRVACGRQHTLIGTDNEGVYALGNNSHGQCGRPIIEDENYAQSGIIKRIDGLEGDVAQLVCGLDHSIALMKDGRVFTFGFAADGQLGNGSYASAWQPQSIQGDAANEKIVQISSSSDCVLAVSDKGDVFGWGNNEYKQLETATTEVQANISRHLPLGIGKVKFVAAGGSSCAAVTASGQVYVWGYGLLGQGPNVTVRSQPSLLPPPLFGTSEFEPEVRAVSVYAGLMHFAAINSKGELYMWGANRHGLLGLGHENDQYFPFKVSLGCNVLKVACGPDHTIALCRPWS